MTFDMLLGYIAIGLGASLAAMAWPFRRGVMGALLTVLAGVGGAVGLAAASHAFPQPPVSSAPLLFAALGAIMALLLERALWFWLAQRAHRIAR